MQEWTLVKSTSPSAEELHTLDLGLHTHSLAALGPDTINRYQRLAVVARAEDGEIIGGIYGEAYWEWVHIRTLWVHEDARGAGLGAQLLAQLEELAAAQGIYQAHLETTDFQALGFYQKQGYEIFGELHGKPAGHTWYFLEKRFFPANGAA